MSCSIRETRTFTIANSVATKNAVKAINKTIKNKLIVVNHWSYTKVRRTPPSKVRLLAIFILFSSTKQQQ
ncbi:hypothetical protein J27TS8_19290 [Robertmurraya siralis]|uniref:Uncharacterized protein n=1 Tax=Robertmurraya siralis TaxID=77777 RepID=A0A919WHS0_9BACI|nr:hypothetical protein J27TS8_19290 [Robertmurraya siralis]